MSPRRTGYANAVSDAAGRTLEEGEMRSRGILVSTMLLAVAAGCAGHTATTCECVVVAPQALSPALLFDRQPGFPTAHQLASRPPWPSVRSANQLGEVIHYRERFFDFQHSGRAVHDSSFRRFDTYREGWSER